MLVSAYVYVCVCVCGPCVFVWPVYVCTYTSFDASACVCVWQYFDPRGPRAIKLPLDGSSTTTRGGSTRGSSIPPGSRGSKPGPVCAAFISSNRSDESDRRKRGG
jgi:hypothetical protein